MATLYASLWVTDLPKHICQEHLAQMFAGFGRICSIRLFSNDPNHHDGLITFGSFEASRAAKLAMNGFLLMGQRIRVDWAHAVNIPAAVGGTSTINSIYLRYSSNQFPRAIKAEDLHRIFTHFGTVTEICVKSSQFDQMTMEQQGTAFLHYESTPEGLRSAFSAVSTMNEGVAEGISFQTVEISKNMKKQFEQHQHHEQSPGPPAMRSPHSPMQRVPFALAMDNRIPYHLMPSPATPPSPARTMPWQVGQVQQMPQMQLMVPQMQQMVPQGSYPYQQQYSSPRQSHRQAATARSMFLRQQQEPFPVPPPVPQQQQQQQQQYVAYSPRDPHAYGMLPFERSSSTGSHQLASQSSHGSSWSSMTSTQQRSPLPELRRLSNDSDNTMGHDAWRGVSVIPPNLSVPPSLPLPQSVPLTAQSLQQSMQSLSLSQPAPPAPTGQSPSLRDSPAATPPSPYRPPGF